QAERVHLDVQDLQLGMADQEAGLRGYLLTTDEAFMAQYDLGRGQVRRAWSALAVDVGDRDLEGELVGLRAAMDAWEGWAVGRDPGARAGDELLARFRAAASHVDGLALALGARFRAESSALAGQALAAGVAGAIVGP